MAKQFKVNFNEEHMKLFQQLERKKMTFLSFPEFVRCAFSEKIAKMGGAKK